MNKFLLSACAIPAGLVLALAVPLSASAHVSASATSTAAGSYSVITFSVPHGCDGSPTTAITIEIPEGIDTVTPTVNPNWSISRELEPLEGADDGTERTASVTYTAATPLDADLRDAFELSLRLPDGQPGDTVEFPVLQSCVAGETVWDGEEVPMIVLTAAEADDHDGHDAAVEHAETDEDDAAAPVSATAGPGDDVLARVLGGLGLVLGTIGLVLGISARRKAAQS
ncbi:YcnI family copper-binding membrane protein [Salinibacterium soli]|uniref:YcnI family protein n=1 Tax=Antiquaquibacter soli TaxID=3064523 RepID=A0ABT9BMQ4_9MICO|nr:YcnI family protein [Protaetiibacter sp. WY-16]MDO7882317.1 YcnI family protein [Protaetiibacter sp. WY-16]